MIFQQINVHDVLEELKTYSLRGEFPCIMAKALFNTGFVKTMNMDEQAPSKALNPLRSFIREYREKPKRLSSFIYFFEAKSRSSFEEFERVFWSFIIALKRADRSHYEHDPRVSADPRLPGFSYSLMEEAFFLILLHPQSPRFARRFKIPAVVFNPHRQFERLRAEDKFETTREIIRKNDLNLQGEENKMLANYGEESEIFQYTGRQYSESEKKALKGDLYAAFSDKQ